MPLYRIYIDEVGNHDLKHAENINERFLSLTGVIIASAGIRNVVAPDMVRLKKEIFDPDPDEPVIFHRKDIIKRRGPFRILHDEEKRREFDGVLLEALARWEYNVVTVIIDKLAHREQYKIWIAHPYHYCLQVLLERFLYFLQDHNAQGDVMVESRGGREDIKLKNSYARLYRSGSDFILAEDFQFRLTSAELKVKPKAANVAGLQIADLVAYPSRREILHERGFLGAEGTTFSDRVIEILLKSKYLRNQRTGEIWRYGKKMLP